MVRDGLLTRFQAAHLLQGKWRNFILSGKYKVLGPLGSGGMGQVFLCEHLVMRRRVAVKIMPAARPDDPATRACVAILAAVPQQLRAQLVKVGSKTGGDVELVLADGRTVKWGSADNSARKAAVLAPLLTRPGKVYDVTTADFPTVS
jgi:serine/threonine protein kinase